jgi:hypothetical protein
LADRQTFRFLVGVVSRQQGDGREAVSHAEQADGQSGGERLTAGGPGLSE